MKHKKVLAFGTFDYVHAGHVFYLGEAKKLGTHLTVLVSRAHTTKKIKGDQPRQNEKTRLKIVRSLKMVDQVILGDQNDVYKCLQKIKPNVIALGYDQREFTTSLPEKIKSLGLNTKIVRLKSFSKKSQKSSVKKKKGEPNDAKVYLVPLAVIIKDDKIFLQQRNDPGTQNHKKWEFPGGSVEWGETVEQCLIREVSEETGFVVKPTALLPKAFTNYRTYEWGRVQIVLLPYLCDLKKDKLKISSREVMNTGWFTFKQAKSKKLLSKNKEMLEITQNILNL